MPSPHLTKIPGQPDISQAVPGMAHFAGTGPTGTKCGQCNWLAPSKKAHMGRCNMYFALTDREGELIDNNNDSCRYFERRRP